jgi:cobalt-zinc-cadmium resistance protein CzcA
MIGRILSMSVKGRWYVLFLTLIIAIYGGWQLTKLPIDAVPDITNKQVQINTVAGALSPVEIEKRVTFPVETALAGIPGLETTRSISRNGFSQVSAIFSEKTDLYFARQQVAERLTQARDTLPASVQPQIGPVTTGLGEVFMYSVEFANPDGKGAKTRDGSPGWQSDGSYMTAEGERLTDGVARAAYLRTVQDWVIRPQLRSVKGVAGIDSIGGYEKQYVVEPDPSKLAAYGVSYTELATALEASNLSVGANFIQRAGEAYLVRADARVRTLDEIQNAVIATRGTVPVAVKDVAMVRVGGDLRTGAATKNGQEVVVGTALMLIGENSRSVAKAVGEKLEDVRKSLPPGVVVNTTLDRSVLVNATIATVERNLTEGAILVAATLFLLLGNVRAAFIAVLIIPLSFLMMAIGMNEMKVPGNLMSLGALDFGLIVDGTVIIIENCLLRLAERQHREGRLLLLPERLDLPGLRTAADLHRRRGEDLLAHGHHDHAGPWRGLHPVAHLRAGHGRHPDARQGLGEGGEDHRLLKAPLRSRAQARHRPALAVHRRRRRALPDRRRGLHHPRPRVHPAARREEPRHELDQDPLHLARTVQDHAAAGRTRRALRAGGGDDVLQDRHRRGGDRPDAAQPLRWLHHPEAAEGMAGGGQDQGRDDRTDRGQGRPSVGQQLRG